MTTFTLTQSSVDGATASFVDTSDIDFSTVKKTRFLFYRFTDIPPAVLTYQNELVQYTEYSSLTITNFTYDNKVVPIAGRIVPQITGILVQQNSSMETQRYSSPTSFLPTINYTPRVLEPADMGITDVEKFPDMIGSLTYEQYGDNSPLTPANVVSGKQYIVTGSGATATYNGNIYRENEVFIASDNGAISFTGGGTVKVLLDLRFSYFAFTYEVERQLAELQALMYRNCNYSQDLVYKVSAWYAIIKGIKFSSIQNYTSAQLVFDQLNDVKQQVNQTLCEFENNV